MSNVRVDALNTQFGARGVRTGADREARAGVGRLSAKRGAGHLAEQHPRSAKPADSRAEDLAETGACGFATASDPATLEAAGNVLDTD